MRFWGYMQVTILLMTKPAERVECKFETYAFNAVRFITIIFARFVAVATYEATAWKKC